MDPDTAWLALSDAYPGTTKRSGKQPAKLRAWSHCNEYSC